MRGKGFVPPFSLLVFRTLARPSMTLVDRPSHRPDTRSLARSLRTGLGRGGRGSRSPRWQRSWYAAGRRGERRRDRRSWRIESPRRAVGDATTADTSPPQPRSPALFQQRVTHEGIVVEFSMQHVDPAKFQAEELQEGDDVRYPLPDHRHHRR